VERSPPVTYSQRHVENNQDEDMSSTRPKTSSLCRSELAEDARIQKKLNNSTQVCTAKIYFRILSKFKKKKRR
jgi:hypothetical protein